MSNPLGYAGFPADQSTAQTKASVVRAATTAEVAAASLKNAYVSPATAGGLETAVFAAPPALGSTTPNAVHATTLGVTTGPITLSNSVNIVAGTSAGTKIGTATNQKFGFYNATPVVQQTQTATALTNSVTAGGTTGTIANFTDLSVYANDAATIRNDIYQLSLALSNVITLLKAYGLSS